MGNVKKGSDDVLHNLYVRMHRSNLPDAKRRWYARTANNRVLNIGAVCDSMKLRGSGSGNYDEMVTNVRQYFEEAAYLLADGFAIDTGYFTICPVIRGSFRTEREALDPQQMRVEFHFRARAPLRRLAGLVKFKILGRRDPGVIERFTDMGSGDVNKRLTGGGLFIMSGAGIKIAGGRPECGVWFAAADGQRHKVTTPIVKNTAGEVAGIAPALPAGAYMVEIITQSKMGGGGLLKNPRMVKGGFTLYCL